MPLALEITFLGMDQSENLESMVRQGAAAWKPSDSDAAGGL